MKRLLSILLLCVVAGVALAEREPLTKDGLQQRLSAFAEQYKAVGPIARMINHDLAFPRSASEYRIMNGFGIIWITAHSQESTELPLQNMWIKTINRNVIEIPPHSSFSSTEKDATVALVLGQHRMDYVYLVPLYEEALGGELFVDYSANRKYFSIAKLPLKFPDELGWLKSFKQYDGKRPEEHLVYTMLNREFPIYDQLRFVRVLLKTRN
jgi:hypothetical protein